MWSTRREDIVMEVLCGKLRVHNAHGMFSLFKLCFVDPSRGTRDDLKCEAVGV